LIFWPLLPLVQHVVAMLRPVCFCAIEDGRYMCPDLRREGVGGIAAVTPIDVEVWISWWWNDRGHIWIRARFSCSCSLCTVMSVPSVRMGAAVRTPVAPRLARGLHTFLERGRSTPRGSGAPVLMLQGSGALMTSWSSGEAKTVARGAYLARDLSARLGRDESWLSASSD
jgi:hypothetical protein